MTDVYNDFMEDADFDTILSSDIDFTGTLRFEKPFLIRGKVSGEIPRVRVTGYRRTRGGKREYPCPACPYPGTG